VFPEGLTVLFRQAKQLQLLKYVLNGHVRQSAVVEEQEAHVEEQLTQAVFELLAGLT
jgi:hypothetical protein